MPWRRTKDAYSIWVSEVMLQQTQVSVVIPYYERWMSRFPTVGSLAQSTEEDVLQVWQGLGYYRRAKSLLAGAKFIVENGFPSDANGWKKVPGVGDYTAGAIASIALSHPASLVDGNVERVFARLTGDRSNGTELSKNAWKWADENISATSPGDWNQGLMELGATLCTPRDPNCSGCPLQLKCRAFLRGLVSELPVASPKPEVKALRQTFWIILFDDSIHLTRSAKNEWWSDMQVLPVSEIPPSDGWAEDLGRFKFTVTNHRITAEVKLLRPESPLEGFSLIPLNQITEVPIPAPHRKALKLLHKI